MKPAAAPAGFRRSRSGRYRTPALSALLREIDEGSPTRRGRRTVATGFQYVDLPEQLVRRLPEWLRLGEVPEGAEIRPRRAYRFDGYLVKFYASGHPWKDLLRRSAAIRSADWHARLLPLRTPQPIVAIEERACGRLVGAVLVTEFVDGPSLAELWRQPQASGHGPLEELVRFLARMHHQRVHHGDVHPANLLWDGAGWVLIDLDGMRGRQRITRRIIERQWVRLLLVLEGEERWRPLFDAYLRVARLAWPPDTAWQRVRDRARALRAARARRS